MSDLDALHSGLESLIRGSAIFSGKERVLADDCEANVRDAMRTEISQTQLLRRVVFRNEHDAKVAFEVNSGRVLKLTEPTSPSLFQNVVEAPNRAASVLPKVEQSDAPVIGAVVARFLAGAKSLWVETQRLDHRPAPTHLGISLDALFPSRAQAPYENLRTFMIASQDFCSAGLLRSGNRNVFEHGPAPHLAMLQKFAKVELTKLNRLADSHENGNCCVIFSGHPLEGGAVLCIFEAEHMALMTFENGALEKILELWNAYSKE